MPREGLNNRQQIIYDMLTKVCDIGDDWETTTAIKQWVNDHFYPELYDVIDTSMEDVELENVYLGWK